MYSNGLHQTPVKKSTFTRTFPLAYFCVAPYKQSREAALPLLPFLGVSSLMNWPGGFTGLFFGVWPGLALRAPHGLAVFAVRERSDLRLCREIETEAGCDPECVDVDPDDVPRDAEPARGIEADELDRTARRPRSRARRIARSSELTHRSELLHCGAT